VSAEKAQEKLSQFQLVEPHLYVQNVVASAVAGGATTLEVKLARSGAALGFDGQTYDRPQLSGLLDQLLNPTDPALQELAVAVNTLRRVSGLKVVFTSISADGEGTRLVGTGGGVQVEEFSTEQGGGHGNLLQVSQPFQLTRFLAGLWSVYGEQVALDTTCYHAPLELSLNGTPVQKEIHVGTESPDCLAWLKMNPLPGTPLIVPPMPEWSASCVAFQLDTEPKEFGCVLALDQPDRASNQGLQMLCNGVLFKRDTSLLNVPFVHGLVWGPLGKNVSHSDLSENVDYWRLITWAQTTAEWLVVQRMESTMPIPESNIKAWLDWAPELAGRLQQREDTESASKVKRWIKETRSLLDLKNDSHWTELVRALDQVTDPIELAARKQRIAQKLQQALEMSLQSALYLDCEQLCTRLIALTPENELAKNLLAATSAVCGREPGDPEGLEKEVTANLLRLNSRSAEAVGLQLSPVIDGQLSLALQQFDLAKGHLERADQNSPDVLESLSDCLAYAPGRTKSAGLQALALRERAVQIRESTGAPWGGILKYDLARLARGVASIPQWVSYRASVAWAGSNPSEVGLKVETDLVKAIDNLNRNPTAIVELKSTLLFAEKAFPLDHIFLRAVRSKAVHALRRAGFWQEADSVLGRGGLLDFILRSVQEGIRITAERCESTPMGLFWLESGDLSRYRFPDMAAAEGDEDSISSAFERLRSGYGSSAEEEGRPVVVASQIMTRNVVTVTESCTLEHALNLMAEHKFRHLPVVSEPGPRLVGIISDRDALLMSADLEEHEVADVIVEEAMSTELLTADPQTEIRLIAETMVDCKISCFPILDQDELLLGIVTTDDVLRSIACHAPLNLWG
jgi:CBS domain-containing protein